MSVANSTITVSAGDPLSRDRQLEQATSLLRERANGWGILVTRVDFTTFTVALSPDVEFGLTREIDLLRAKPDVSHAPKAFFLTQQESEPGLREEEEHEEAEKHPLLA